MRFTDAAHPLRAFEEGPKPEHPSVTIRHANGREESLWGGTTVHNPKAPSWHTNLAVLRVGESALLDGELVECVTQPYDASVIHAEQAELDRDSALRREVYVHPNMLARE